MQNILFYLSFSQMYAKLSMHVKQWVCRVLQAIIDPPTTYLWPTKYLSYHLCLIPLFEHVCRKYTLHKYTYTNCGLKDGKHKKNTPVYQCCQLGGFFYSKFYYYFRIVTFVLINPSFNKGNNF